MKFTTMSEFTTEDKKINEQLNTLFTRWLEYIKPKYTVLDDDCFVTDGIFPGYSNQKIKILYIGNEPRHCYGSNYIDTFLPELWKNKVKKVKTTVDQNDWYRRILKISYGILHDCIDFKLIPDASVIAKNVCKDNNISFAIINISKIDNNNKSIANGSVITKFTSSTVPYGNTSKQNYYIEQIKIINPDIIISMIDKSRFRIFKGKINLNNNIKNICYTLDCGYKKIPVLDSTHFAAHCYDDYKNFYEPICSALKFLGICKCV